MSKTVICPTCKATLEFSSGFAHAVIYKHMNKEHKTPTSRKRSTGEKKSRSSSRSK